MSAAANTPAKSTFRRGVSRVTAVADVIAAQALEAACVGSGMVALHFATAEGIVVVRCPVDSFCTVARTPRDHHGNPWPAFNGSRREALQAKLEADAASSIPKGMQPRQNRSPRFHPALADLPTGGVRANARKLSDETIASLRTAWERCQADPTIKVAHVVRQVGVTRPTVDAYFARFQAQRSPVLKPSGAIL